jgi:hypothetical protein
VAACTLSGPSLSLRPRRRQQRSRTVSLGICAIRVLCGLTCSAR